MADRIFILISNKMEFVIPIGFGGIDSNKNDIYCFIMEREKKSIKMAVSIEMLGRTFNESGVK